MLLLLSYLYVLFSPRPGACCMNLSGRPVMCIAGAAVVTDSDQWIESCCTG